MVWQSLLRSWIGQQASQQVYESVQKAAQARTASSAASASERPPPADVAVVFALQAEAGGLTDLLEGVTVTRTPDLAIRQGTLQSRRVVLVESGVGTLAAVRGTQALIAGHRPGLVISSGFAGALDPRLKRGDIILADSVVDSEGHRLAIDLKVSAESLAATPRTHVGQLLTSQLIVRRPDEKRALGQAHQALAVDMESWAVGEVCRQAKTPFLAVRIVSDTVDDELPAEIESLARQKTGAARLGAAAGAIFRRPSSVKDMLKLKEHALIHSDRLARFLAGMITQMVPERSAESP